MIAWGEPSPRLDREALGALLNGSIPAIRVADFATGPECAAACRAIRAPERRRRAATTSSMDLIGSNFSNHAGPRKRDYFDTVEAAYEEQALVFGQAFDVMGRVLGALRSAWDGEVDYACEPAPYGRYFAGGIKVREAPSHLHFDYVPHFAPDYEIGRVVDQFSWNLYLEMPADTGETTIYRAAVSRDSRPPTIGGYTTLPEAFVAGMQSYEFHAKVGELVLFNTRHAHRISYTGSGGSRIQIGSFVGRTADDRLVLWS